MQVIGSWSKAAALAATLAMSPWLALAAPQGEAGIGMPRDISTEGHRIDSLIHVTAVLVGVLFAVMVGWMLYAALRHNSKHPARYEKGDGPAGKVLPIGLAALVFVVVDGNLFYNSTRDIEHVFWNFGEMERRPDALKVQVNARQWAWDFRYPGPDGQFNTADDIVTLNDFRVPVGRPVVLQLGSTDVVHSLNLPHVRVKIDAMPGTISRAWFEAKQTGEFEVACAQHCGTHHYKMRGLFTVLPAEDFDRWAQEASILAQRGFDPADSAALWGWAWKEHR